MKAKMTVEERFWSKTRPAENGCIEWTAYRRADGYGVLGVAGKKTALAHRFAWELKNGPMPIASPGMTTHGVCVLHRCDNPPCVNPDHLFLGTQADNIHDMVAKSRHGTIRLSDKQVAAIRGLRGIVSGVAIAREYGITPGYVSSIQSGAHRADAPGQPVEPYSNNAPRRPLVGESHPNAKLTREQIIEIRSKRGTVSQASLAAAFGVTQTTIGAIQRGQSWAHVQ